MTISRGGKIGAAEAVPIESSVLIKECGETSFLLV